MSGHRVVSVFCGCGGLDLGFLQAGFDLVYACDNDPAAVACYARNIDERVFCGDATSDAFHDDIRKVGRCDVVLGGFPCQGFSKAGPKQEDDSRNALYCAVSSPNWHPACSSPRTSTACHRTSAAVT